MPLHITDARNCAIHYKAEFIDKYYKVTTTSNSFFILKSQEKQFPHLIGIEKSHYQRSSMRASDVYDELLKVSPHLPRTVLSRNINESSKKGKKIKNFTMLKDSFFSDSNTLCVFYNELLSTSRLSHVNYLFSNYKSGYSSGWIYDTDSDCCRPVTWIDESTGTQTDKEKYYGSQTLDLIAQIEIFDSSTDNLIDTYVCKRTIKDYIHLIGVLNRNNMILKIKKKKVHIIIFHILKFLRIFKFSIKY